MSRISKNKRFGLRPYAARQMAKSEREEIIRGNQYKKERKRCPVCGEDSDIKILGSVGLFKCGACTSVYDIEGDVKVRGERKERTVEYLQEEFEV